MLTRCFQQIYRTYGIHVKIKQGNVSSLVMGRLRCAMYDQVEAMFLKESGNPVAIPYIELAMFEPRCGFLKPPKIPISIAGRTEKDTPHIIVHADYVMALPVKMFHCL
jgi:hypothetical protein